jgi:hypothetical protein
MQHKIEHSNLSVVPFREDEFTQVVHRTPCSKQPVRVGILAQVHRRVSLPKPVAGTGSVTLICPAFQTFTAARPRGIFTQLPSGPRHVSKPQAFATRTRYSSDPSKTVNM